MQSGAADRELTQEGRLRRSRVEERGRRISPRPGDGARERAEPARSPGGGTSPVVLRRHGRRHRGDSLLCTRCRPASCDVVDPTRWRPAASDPCGTAVGTPDGSEFLARGDPCGWIVFQAGHDPLLVFLRGVHGAGRTNPSPNNGRAWPLAMTRPPPSTSQLSPWQASPSGQQRDPEETA